MNPREEYRRIKAIVDRGDLMAAAVAMRDLVALLPKAERETWIQSEEFEWLANGPLGEFVTSDKGGAVVDARRHELLRDKEGKS